MPLAVRSRSAEVTCDRAGCERRCAARQVCHEYTPEQGLEQYELVAHLPDKANNYLGPALAVLEKNT